MRENLERYKNDQPVDDSEQQLAGKIVDEEVIGALQQTGYMTPQHMMLIDTILTSPGVTVEAEHQRRIAAINAVVAFCDVEEGPPISPLQSRKRLSAKAMIPVRPRSKISHGKVKNLLHSVRSLDQSI